VSGLLAREFGQPCGIDLEIDPSGRTGPERNGRGTPSPGGGFGRKGVMQTVLTVLVGLTMLAVLGVLFAGMLGFVRDGQAGERGNVLMRWRVLLQGAALALFAMLLFLTGR